MPESAEESRRRAAIPVHQRIDRDLKRASGETNRILTFVRGHLFDPRLTVGWILANLKLSHNVSSRFRRRFGIGLKRYLEARRLETARRLLVDTDLEIREIATLIGYRRFEAFSHAFKQRVGRRPKTYRNARRRSGRRAATAAPAIESSRPTGVPRFVAGTSALQAGARCGRCGGGLRTESSARVFENLEPICDLCALAHAPSGLVDFLHLNAPHLRAASIERLRRGAGKEEDVEVAGG